MDEAEPHGGMDRVYEERESFGWVREGGGGGWEEGRS